MFRLNVKQAIFVMLITLSSVPGNKK